MSALDRLTRYFDACVRKAVADVLATRPAPYVVVACNKLQQTVSLRSLTAAMPNLTDVPMRAPGLVLELAPNTPVTVAVDGNGNPYVDSYASGGLPPIVPGTGSGVQNEIDAGYILITQILVPQPAVVTALYFPAGTTGKLAAETAKTVAISAGLAAFLLHMSGGRVLPDGWTVP